MSVDQKIRDLLMLREGPSQETLDRAWDVVQRKIAFEDTTVISCGIICLSLCVPAGLTHEQIAYIANAKMPTGISSQWAISDDTHFSGGQTNPCDCERGPAHQHYLLNC